MQNHLMRSTPLPAALLAVTMMLTATTATAANVLASVTAAQMTGSDSSPNSLTANVTDRFTGPRATGGGTADVDGVAGTLKIGADVAYTGISDNDQQSRAAAVARLGETFTITGTGTVSFLMDYDGTYDAARHNFSGNILAVGTGPGVLVSPAGERVFSQTSDTYDAGSFGGQLRATYAFDGSGPAVLTTTWTLRGFVDADTTNRNAMFDATNTAYISILASDGISISSQDAQFLNGAFSDAPTTVPLPAGGLLLLCGLLGTAIFGRRRHAKTETQIHMS